MHAHSILFARIRIDIIYVLFEKESRTDEHAFLYSTECSLEAWNQSPFLCNDTLRELLLTVTVKFWQPACSWLTLISVKLVEGVNPSGSDLCFLCVCWFVYWKSSRMFKAFTTWMFNKFHVQEKFFPGAIIVNTPSMRVKSTSPCQKRVVSWSIHVNYRSTIGKRWLKQ